MKTPPDGKYRCPHCNHNLDAPKQRCPACRHSQSRLGEFLAIALMFMIVGLVAVLQLRKDEQAAVRFEDKSASGEASGSSASEQRVGRPYPALESPRSDTTPEDVRPASVYAKTPPKPRAPKNPQTVQRDAAKSADLPYYRATKFQQGTGDFPFYVAEKIWDNTKQEYRFIRKGMHGGEVRMRSDSRRYFLSENQSDYPEPQSGCGPTALLNLYIWYTKFGLLQESVRHADPERYKQFKFRQIDRKLLNIQRQSRTRNGGTNTLAAIVAMDELVQEHSRKNLRLHFEIKPAPLTKSDFIELSQNYRAGILSVRPKSPGTGRLMGNHAVLCIRGDRDGMITVANWGEFSHGSLVDREDGQWFVPRNGKGYELKINTLTTVLPFVPRI